MIVTSYFGLRFMTRHMTIGVALTGSLLNLGCQPAAEEPNFGPSSSTPSPTQVPVALSNCYTTDGQGNLVKLEDGESRQTSLTFEGASSPVDVPIYVLCSGDISGPINISESANIVGDSSGTTRIVMPMIEEPEEDLDTYGFYIAPEVEHIHISDVAIHGQGYGTGFKGSQHHDLDLQDLSIDGIMDIAIEVEATTGRMENITIDLGWTGRGIYVLDSSDIVMESIDINGVYGDGIYVEDSDIVVTDLSLEEVREVSYTSPSKRVPYISSGFHLISTGESNDANGEINSLSASNMLTETAIIAENSTLTLNNALILEAKQYCLMAGQRSTMTVNESELWECGRAAIYSEDSDNLTVNGLGIQDTRDQYALGYASIDLRGLTEAINPTAHLLKDVSIKRTEGPGIYARAVNVDIVDAHIDDSGAFGIGIDNAISTVSGSTITGVRKMSYSSWSSSSSPPWSGLEAGIYIPPKESDYADIRLENNSIEGSYIGIRIDEQNATIVDTEIDDVEMGLRIEGLYSSDFEVNIDGLNTFDGWSRGVETAINANNIDHLTIVNSTIRADRYGVRTLYTNDLYILNSTFRQSGIGVGLNQSVATIEGSYFDDVNVAFSCNESQVTLNGNTYVNADYNMSECDEATPAASSKIQRPSL